MKKKLEKLFVAWMPTERARHSVKCQNVCLWAISALGALWRRLGLLAWSSLGRRAAGGPYREGGFGAVVAGVGHQKIVRQLVDL